MRRKLDHFGDLLGLVVGRFNKVSNDLKNLLEKRVESRLALVARMDVMSSLTLRRGGSWKVEEAAQHSVCQDCQQLPG